jgi:L-lactate dehydrogenase complex protein LldE
MRVGLFVPCYIDQFYPGVAIATLELLERLGCSVSYPVEQTCCGQPLANAGFGRDSDGAMRLFIDNFAAYDFVVTPSGSCALHVREHYDHLEQTADVEHVRARTYELCEFLIDVLGVQAVRSTFPFRVGLHAGCHGLRGLRLGQASELNGAPFNKVRQLLESVEAIELVELHREDECCGFGGSFAVSEETVSVRMGQDRLADHVASGAEVITSADMSCLMHLEGLARRQKLPIRVAHVAEILNGSAR